MKKPRNGPSLFYATDKNVFDALNQHKVDVPTVMALFQRRNIIVGQKTPREDLARYFCRLTHDYFDHKDIAARLGIAARRERITSMDVSGVGDPEELKLAVEKIKQELETTGDVIQLSKDGDNLTMHVQYSTVDYKLSEFSQVQVRDGTVEFIKTEEGYKVRNTQNEYLDGVRDTLLGNIETEKKAPIKRMVVSLFDMPSPRIRSSFFYKLTNDLPGYVRRDVTDVYVYKAKPEGEAADDSDSDDSDLDTYVERIFLRGNGVTRSKLLNELLDAQDYYIVKITWITTETMGAGHAYEIEAVFSDPKNCTGFSFILTGIYPREENGKISSRRRAPLKHEIDEISKVIEARSRTLVSELREELKKKRGSEIKNAK